ncbi:tripartite tricarboxylate transporter TctB family protein [Microbacterium sp. NPDC058342]|uniref:tripartite tricarboxylate transporter TctB family protein n=1 Tax=Microbacterium sp. NPDC058342 TaxID=3346454 RepID=UPI00365F9894
MTSNVSTSPAAKSRTYLEWWVVGVSLAGGIAVAISGLGFGLTNTTGVGAGFFPLVAGAAIALGSLLWGFQILGELRERRREGLASSSGEIGTRTFEDKRVDPPTDTALGALVVDGIDEEDDDIVLPDRQGVIRIASVVVALVLAAIALPFLGYLLTMTLMLFAVMTLVSARRWWVALIVAVVAAFASRFVFETLLGTALPHPAIDILRVMGL